MVFALLSDLPRTAAQDALDDRIEQAYRAAYNLDRETALDIARRAVADYPEASKAHRTLAAILWLQALFHRGALTVDHYTGGITTSSLDLPPAPEAITRQFRDTINEAIRLAEQAVQKRPDDPDALYDLGAAYGLQASWTASVEGSVRRAFSPARRAFNLQERVLELHPDRRAAGAIVGTYRYAVARMRLPSRLLAYVAGFGGGREQGVALLEAAATPGSESRFEAQTALVLIYSREERHEDAYRLLTEMSKAFPGNRILVLERGSAALRAGRPTEAERILLDGVNRLADDARPRIPGEEALWHFKLGLARLELGRRTDAARSLQVALDSRPEPWMRGRIELALGKIADLDGRRSAALERYRRARDIGRTSGDQPTAEEARQLLRRPFELSCLCPPLHTLPNRPRHPARPALV